MVGVGKHHEMWSIRTCSGKSFETRSARHKIGCCMQPIVVPKKNASRKESESSNTREKKIAPGWQKKHLVLLCSCLPVCLFGLTPCFRHLFLRRIRHGSRPPGAETKALTPMVYLEDCLTIWRHLTLGIFLCGLGLGLGVRG